MGHENRNAETEVRSEKVRKLLGEIPPSLIRWGPVVLAAIFIALLTAACLIRHPYGNGESILMHMLH